jgi:hypothetical protein
MAEALTVVCDDCGKPAVDTLSFKVNGASRQKDVCAQHKAEILNGSRPATRGRPRTKGVSAPRRKPVGRKRKTAAKK